MAEVVVVATLQAHAGKEDAFEVEFDLLAEPPWIDVYEARPEGDRAKGPLG
jgi:hypothetical protein